MTERDLAAEGRRLLREWKADHVIEADGTCQLCGHLCPTARLVAAVEEALRVAEDMDRLTGYRGKEAGAILAKLAEGR